MGKHISYRSYLRKILQKCTSHASACFFSNNIKIPFKQNKKTSVQKHTKQIRQQKKTHRLIRKQGHVREEISWYQKHRATTPRKHLSIPSVGVFRCFVVVGDHGGLKVETVKPETYPPPRIPVANEGLGWDPRS